MPLSLAIAVASGAPPAAGLLTAIVAGLVLPCFGGSYVTITAPAAGMAPVLFQAIHTLGHGNLALGYPLILPLIVLMGLIQLALSRLQLGVVTRLLPVTVITGMLTAIGLIVLVKQMPLLLGHPFASHTILAMVAEFPQALTNAHPVIATLGAATLALVGAAHLMCQRYPPLRVIPPFFYALILGTGLSMGLGLGSEFLLPLPANPLDSLVWPDWRSLTTASLAYPAAIALLTLLIVDTVESLATLRAVDRLDRYGRAACPQQSILGIGACNIASGLLGGLTVIPEVMRSTVNILAGARTQWANLVNALALLLGWLTLQPVLTHIPLTVLAAVLITVSLNLCRPAHWVQAWQLGPGAFAVFIVTVGMTLGFDLLWGLLSGTLLSLCLPWTSGLLKR